MTVKTVAHTHTDIFRQLYTIAEMSLLLGSDINSHLYIMRDIMILAYHPVKGQGKNMQMETFSWRDLNFFFTTEITYNQKTISFL